MGHHMTAGYRAAIVTETQMKMLICSIRHAAVVRSPNVPSGVVAPLARHSWREATSVRLLPPYGTSGRHEIDAAQRANN